jgi:hypothetical protein
MICRVQENLPVRHWNQSKYCEALVLIGDIYIAASSNFGANDFEKSSVFWVAVDYYERARSHADCAMDASKKLTTTVSISQAKKKLSSWVCRKVKLTK